MPANYNVSPRSLGRQLHIPRMAIAAAAIILLFATHVRASIAYFVVDSQSSWLQETRKLVGPALGGSKTGVPQSLGSDTTHFFGDMYVDIQDTTIQLLPGASLSAMVTGDYAPHDYVFQDPPGDPYPIGVTPQANYGISLPAIGGSIVQYNLRMDNGAPGVGFPSTPIALVGDHFNLGGQAMSFTDGREAFLSVITPLNESKSLVGEPFIFFWIWGQRHRHLGRRCSNNSCTLVIQSGVDDRLWRHQ
jgi:hypothetical protein